MADKKVTFQIEIIDGKAITKVKGTTAAVHNLGNEVQKVNTAAKGMNNNLKGVNDAAGLTSATITSLGQGIGDLRYGFGAIANNLTQVGSLFGNLTTKSGGFVGALKNIGSGLLGPAGIFLAFNAVVAAIDYFTSSMGKAEEKIKDATKSLKEQLEVYKDYQLIVSELKGEDRVKFLTQIALKENEVAKALKEAGTNEAERIRIIENLIAEIEQKIAIETAGMELVEAKREEIAAKKLRSELETRGKNARDRNRDKKQIVKLDNQILLIQEKINAKTKAYTALLKDVKTAATEMTNPIIEFYEQLDVDTLIDAENANPTGILRGLMGDDFGEDVSIGSIGMGFIEDFEFTEQLDNLSSFLDAKKDLRDKDLSDEQQAYNQRQRLALLTAGLASVVGQSMKEGSKEAARIQQAAALINAFASINEIWSKKSSSPFLSASLAEKIAATASVSAITFGNVKAIQDASKQFGGSGASASSRSFDFNIVGGNTNNTNAITSAINSQGQVVKAYVTTTDVKTATQLEDNLVNKATITDD